MNLHELAPGKGVRRQKRRVGRGHGSGRGKTSGKGTKGQNARSGGGTRLGFEGGQNPWTMRVPHKRGFNRGYFRVETQVINLSDIESHFSSGDDVTLDTLAKRGLIRDTTGKKPVKLLGRGEITKAITLTVHQASKSAREAVSAAGGSLTLLLQTAVDEPDESSETGDTPPAAGEGSEEQVEGSAG